MNTLHFKIYFKKVILNYNNILQYYCVAVFFNNNNNNNNAALVSIRDNLSAYESEINFRPFLF